MTFAQRPASNSAEGGTWLARREHEGPFVVQRPFFPEGPRVCHVCLVHPPGGLVGGDQLELVAHVETGAHALLTTPAAGKIYRSGGRATLQQNLLSVADAATMEWFPLETLLFSGAETRLRTMIDLAPHAALAAWDIVVFGRPACHETFTAGWVRQRFEVTRAGKPVFIESAHFTPKSGVFGARWGLASAPVLGFFLVSPVPDGAERLLDSLRALALTLRPDELCVTTRLRDALVMRYLGPSAERARGLFVQAWQLARPGLCGRSAVPPRIWSS